MCLFFLRHLLHLVGWLHAPSECCVHAAACVICCIAWCTANQRRVLFWAQAGDRTHFLCFRLTRSTLESTLMCGSSSCTTSAKAKGTTKDTVRVLLFALKVRQRTR